MKLKIIQIAAHPNGGLFALAEDGTAWVLLDGAWEKLRGLPDSDPEDQQGVFREGPTGEPVSPPNPEEPKPVLLKV